MIRALLMAGSLSSAGCAIVTVEGDARVTRPAFGVLRIEPGEGAHAAVYRVRGVGLVPGRDGATLGAKDETAAIVWARDDCRILLFQPDAAAVAAMLAAIAAGGASPSTLCIAGEK